MTNAFNRSSVCGETAQRLQALLQFGVGGEARCSGFVALEREREVHVAAVFLSRCKVGIEERGAVKELHGLFKTAHAGFNHRQVVVWLRNFGIFGNERTKGFGGFLRAAEPFERDGSAEAKLGAAGIFFQAKVGKFKRLCRVSGLEKLINAGREFRSVQRCGEFLHFRGGHRGAGSGGETCRKGGAEKRGENVTAQRAAETENGHRRQLE